MKKCPFVLLAVLLLSGCAGVHVTRTQVASGATNPKAIYIRPFDVTYADFRGRHSDRGERPIRRSLAPAEFGMALKEQLEKLAPAMVLKEDEQPRPGSGWLVEGYFETVHAGSPGVRAIANPLGRSTVRIHVRITDLERAVVAEFEGKDSKGVALEQTTVARRGNVIYEFDVAGGSGLTGPLGFGPVGVITQPAGGLGYETPFDYKNAAERIMMALTPDAHRYGVRTSPTIF